ncbi:MAG: triose-phosphate isomerase [Chitinophagaceae bacterium]
MRKKIAAANWKMNLTLQQGEALLDGLLAQSYALQPHQEVVVAVPFPYLPMAVQKLQQVPQFYVAAQNCYTKASGAYTGEVSVDILQSVGVQHIIIGHSERREYFQESNQFLAEKVDAILAKGATPIFCCGEPLPVREANEQNAFVAKQLQESLYHLSAEAIQKVVIAYEPIWAIGTGKTATSTQAQEIHAFLRSELAGKYGATIADNISILYGGSVKANNAVELFSQPDVDGGLVGGASLIVEEFAAIIKALP